jgi:uncharacterized membrane protein
MNNPLYHRIFTITLFVTAGLIGLYPAALVMFTPFDTVPTPDIFLPVPAVFWLACLTSLVAIFTSSVAIYQIIKRRPTSAAVTIFSTLIALTALSFIPLTQYASPGQDCMSGCITTYTNVAPSLLGGLEILFVIGGCALLALLLLNFRHQSVKARQSKKTTKNK